jgi:hypothetical protein
VKLPNKAKLQIVSSSLDATYLVVAMERAGSTLGARSVRMALDSEEHYHTRAWQVHRFSGTPSRRWGVLPTEVGPIGLRKPTLRFFDGFGQDAVGLRSTSSGVVLVHRYAYKPSSIVAGGYQADCYKLHLSCILTGVLDRSEPAAR